MARTDLHTTVHKGIRAELFAAALHVARTDFSAEDEAFSAGNHVSRMLGLAALHAALEDAVTLPALGRVCPEILHELHGEHARLSGSEHELARMVADLARVGREQRVALGRKLHERLGRFVADQLAHLEREETTSNRILWAHYDDERLAAFQREIDARVPAHVFPAWLAIALPAVSSPERTVMLSSLRLELAPAEFEEVTAQARTAFGPERWSAVIEAVDAAERVKAAQSC